MKFNKIEAFQPPKSKKPKPIAKVSLRNWKESRNIPIWITGRGQHKPIPTIDNDHLVRLIAFCKRCKNRQYCGYSINRWTQFFLKEQTYRKQYEI